MATYTDISSAEAALLANLDFEEVASVSKAKAVISAANAWMILRPESASSQSEALTVGKAFVENILKRARQYVAANTTAATGTANNAGAVYLGFDR